MMNEKEYEWWKKNMDSVIKQLVEKGKTEEEAKKIIARWIMNDNGPPNLLILNMFDIIVE